MTTFQQHLFQAARRALENIPQAVRADVYVLSFRIWRVDHDERRPYVAIGYHTESELREQLAAHPGMNAAEARWSYAYWPLERCEVIGDAPEDPVGSALHTAEIKALGLWYDDAAADEEADDASEEVEEKMDRINDLFADSCVALVAQLHTDGVVQEVLGRPVPAVIFDMYEADREVTTTKAANPAELLAGFLEFNGE